MHDELRPETYFKNSASSKKSETLGLPEDVREEIIEELAEHIHDDQWCGWLKYQEELGVFVSGHSKVHDWIRKANTSYENLTNKEKESDRIEARKIIQFLEDRGLEIS